MTQPELHARRAAPAMGELIPANILITAAIRHGDREALFCSETGRRFTFRQLNERCNRLSNALTVLGLKKGDVVALLSTNRVELVDTMMALSKTGLVGMPLNYRMTPAEMVALMRSVNAVGMVCEARFADVARKAGEEIEGMRHRVVFGGAVPGMADFDALMAAASPAEPDVDVRETDPFYFNLTSGSTGLPKCYVLTHYNCAAGTGMFDTMGVNRNDVILTVFPMFGRVGISWYAAGLMCGARNVIMNFEPGRALQLIQQEKVTITNLVPTMAAMLLQHPELRGFDLSSLRAIVFAGSMLPAPIREATAQLLCPGIMEYYGMQETGALTVSLPEDRTARPDSVGRLVMHSRMAIVDDNGAPLPPGQLGEIVGRAPAATTAYYENPSKTAETFRGRWIHTGDLGMVDEEGYLFIRGRKKDMIVTGGQNVFAAEVEEALLAHPDVQECAVLGLPDPLWGERVSAVVVLRAGSAQTAADLEALCRQSLAGFKTPKQFILQTEPLPRTPTGKVQKFMLAERYGEAS